MGTELGAVPGTGMNETIVLLEPNKVRVQSPCFAERTSLKEASEMLSVFRVREVFMLAG